MTSIFKSHPLLKINFNSFSKIPRHDYVISSLLGLWLCVQIVARLFLSIYYYGTVGIWVGLFITSGLTLLEYTMVFLVKINYIIYNKKFKPIISLYLTKYPFLYRAAPVLIIPGVNLTSNDILASCHTLMTATAANSDRFTILERYLNALESTNKIVFMDYHRYAFSCVREDFKEQLARPNKYAEYSFTNWEPVDKVCKELNLGGFSKDSCGVIETLGLPNKSSIYMNYQTFEALLTDDTLLSYFDDR